ncbi:phosphoacetylglucosamine mutase [Nematocida sp. AWRm80]|nr:phosphoacetylglucosamine mutase [Nematocida sp. AWRm80]
MNNTSVFNREKEGRVEYGTAGYRDKTDRIEDIVSRAYLVCAIQSGISKCPIGMVITASHNPGEDNGIKYVDKNGNMFNEKSEEMSNQIVNASNSELPSVISKYSLEKSRVFICRDTRESGERMTNKCLKASEALSGNHLLFDLGVCTTPQMHYIIREIHKRKVSNEECTKEIAKEILATYYKRIDRFTRAIKRVFGEQSKIERVLDSSNGVAKRIIEPLRDSFKEIADIFVLQNTQGLNEKCGSDYIKTKRELPAGVTKTKDSIEIVTDRKVFSENKLICSFDGDADRIVYLSPESNKIIDGDRLCVLLTLFINHLLTVVGSKIGITSVVTDYSNGAAMKKLQSISDLKIAGTGVKNMQREASKHTISVWFESNGHGTIYFSEKTKGVFKEKAQYTRAENILDLETEAFTEEMNRILSMPIMTLDTPQERKHSSWNEKFISISAQEANLLLLCISDLIDPFIGDAIMNMVVIESIFYSMFIRPTMLTELYKDLPYVLTSTAGKKDLISTLFVESIKAKYSDLRVHLRPSGTEDLIRVYVEGEDKNQLDKAVDEIIQAITEIST